MGVWGLCERGVNAKDTEGRRRKTGCNRAVAFLFVRCGMAAIQLFTLPFFIFASRLFHPILSH